MFICLVYLVGVGWFYGPLVSQLDGCWLVGWWDDVILAAKEMTGILKRLHKHMENSCAWLGSVGSSIKSLKSKEGFLRLIKMRDERLATEMCGSIVH